MANCTKNEQCRDICYLSFLYMLAHIGILFIPNAIYWDDWVIYNMKSDFILSIFREAGSMFNFAGYLHIALLDIGPWIYKVLTFILMLGSGVFLYFILMPIEKISKKSRFLIVLLFLILPLSMARFALIEIGYTICYFLFFAAWYYKNVRLLALPLFFLSFNTNSLLVFYAIPIAHMFYESNSRLNIKSVTIVALRKIDYLLLPFMFFWIKITWFKPYGDYAGYNEGYALGNLISAPLSQVANLLRLKIITFSSMAFSVATYIIASKYFHLYERGKQNSKLFIRLGFLSLLFGLIPYWILGYVPTFYEWTSRHQLLMPLGSAFLLIGVFQLITGEQFKAAFISLVIGISLSLNMNNYYKAYMDWNKQKSLMELFANNEAIRNSNLILFKDETMSRNALGRSYRFYEWNGMMKKVFGNEKRFGLYQYQLEDFKSGKFDSSFKHSYSASEFFRDGKLNVICVHILKKSGVKLGEKITLKFNPQYEYHLEVVTL